MYTIRVLGPVAVVRLVRKHIPAAQPERIDKIVRRFPLSVVVDADGKALYNLEKLRVVWQAPDVTPVALMVVVDLVNEEIDGDEFGRELGQG